ncbi:MAG: MFS transporter [Chitinophagales bacterium]
MFASVYKIYTNSYKDLTRSVWILAFIQLINRSGSMVLPFMTVYITKSLGFSIPLAGLIISFFGAGSLVGSFLGGYLTDKIGPFKVQFFSLVLGGISYLALPFITNFYLLAGGFFICALINDSLRPAASSLISHFSTPETTTRSFSLLRMAINLGVAIGPAVAGLLAGINYTWLFVGDGLTCIAAGLVFYFYFRSKQPQTHKTTNEQAIKARSPYRSTSYLLFIGLCMLYALAFFSIFTGIPLYYKDVYHKSEETIGLLIGFNGLIVFIFEMVIVSQIEKRFAPARLIVFGSLLLGLSFILFNLWTGTLLLLVSMALLSFSEIFAMPFMISHVVNSATPQTRGSFIAGYTIAWSVAFIISPYGSAWLIENYDFETLWWVMGGLCAITALGFRLQLKQAPAKIHTET